MKRSIILASSYPERVCLFTNKSHTHFFPQRVGDPRGRRGERIGSRDALWERDHLADRGAVAKNGQQTIHSDGEAAVWRRAVLQRIQQVVKLGE